MLNLKTLLNKKFITTKNQITINSPIDFKPIGAIPSLSKEDINLAYEVAYQSFLERQNEPYQIRIDKIKRFVTILQTNLEYLADVECKEISKPIKDCKTEISRSIDYINQTIDEYMKLMENPMVYDNKKLNNKNKNAIFQYVPLGVVLLMSPFNYPINLSLAKIIPALLCGNSVIFKPSTQGSLCGLLLTEYLYQAGFNNNEVNTITGKGSEIGDSLITNDYIKMISFTGSTNVGKDISKKSKMASLVLELGGKDPAIVLEDADLEKTATSIIKGAFNYSGQRCTAIKRVICHNKIADKLAILLKDKVNQLKVGNPFNNCDITPLISINDANFAMSLAKEAINKGAIALNRVYQEQNLLYPLVLDQVTPEMKIATIEQFAPILPIIRFNDIKEAIQITNHCNLALQASIYTSDLKVANLIATKLEVGSVNINDASSRGPDIMPFLGVKDSGLGVQGIVEALKSMMRLKGIVFNKV